MEVPTNKFIGSWNCRFHPTDWWHEIGCPHREWTKEELRSSLLAKKQFEEKYYQELNEQLKYVSKFKKEIRKILKEQVAQYCGLFDEATCVTELMNIISHNKYIK